MLDQSIEIRCSTFVIPWFALSLAAGVLFSVGCSANPISNPAPHPPPVVTADTKNPLPDLNGAASAGQQLYYVHCALCHGKDGDGETAAGSALAAKPTDLTTGNLLSVADGEIFLVIKNGKMTDGKLTMPPVKELSDEQIWQLVAYVRRLAKK